MTSPSMKSRGKEPIAIFPVNGEYILAVYQGGLSEFDLLLKYRQKKSSTRSGWSRIRTPKHIHWAVDLLLKMHANRKETERFLDFLIQTWDNNIQPLRTAEERRLLLDVDNLLKSVDSEASKYKQLAKSGEYSIKFLILIAKLLMIQEKTNFESAYMFKNLLDALKSGEDIFKIVSIATHH